MKSKTNQLTTAAIAAGLLGLCLRLVLYRTGFDEKDILSSSHPLHLACLALCALMAVYLVFSLRSIKQGSDAAERFPRSPLQSLGILAAAVLTLLHGLGLTRVSGDWMDKARMVLAFAAGASMVLCALPRSKRRPRMASLGIITVFYALDMLCRYPGWSGNPQLPDYVFQVFACVLLALTSYHRLAFDAGLGKYRRLLFCSLMSLFLCLLCAAGPDTRPFYLGGACWTGACIDGPEFSVKNEQEEES